MACSLWGHKELDMTEHTQQYLKNTQIIIVFMLFLYDSSYHLGMEKVTFEYLLFILVFIRFFFLIYKSTWLGGEKL